MRAANVLRTKRSTCEEGAKMGASALREAAHSSPEVDWHAYRLHFTRCPPSCLIKGGSVKAQRAHKKPGHPTTEIRHIVTVPQEHDYSIPSQKPGKAQLGWKVGNTTVPNPWIKPKNPEFTTQKAYSKYLRA